MLKSISQFVYIAVEHFVIPSFKSENDHESQWGSKLRTLLVGRPTKISYLEQDEMEL